MAKENNILIHQTLHGYDGGHSLLGSSRELPVDVRMLMLPISDMSGNSILPGFEEYITGYPLKEINAYAIAKTWYASEMRRPGCVWTQTLLIDFADLPYLRDIEFLFTLFRRPVSTVDFEFYKHSSFLPRNILDKEYINTIDNKFSENFIKGIITQLYDINASSVLIRGVGAFGYDKLVLSIWLQQWPRMRRNFTFCTGAIMPRVFQGKELDLQIVPISTIDDGRKSFRSIIDSRYEPNFVEQAWVDQAYNDWLVPGKLRTFLRTYGADVKPELSCFSIMVRTFLFLKESHSSVREIIFFLANSFPFPAEAGSLKNTILGEANLSHRDLGITFSEQQKLFELSITDVFGAFDYQKLKYKDRFLDYVAINTDESIDFLSELFKHDLNQNGINVIQDLAIYLEDNYLLSRSLTNSKLASIFVGLNPRIAYQRDFWETKSGEYAEIIDSLSHTSNEQSIDWHKIITLILDVDPNVDLNLFEKVGVNLQDCLLDYLQIHPDGYVSSSWLSALRSQPRQVLEWLNRQTQPALKILELLVGIMDPNDYVVIKNDASPWLGLIRDKRFIWPKSVSDNICAFGLCLGLNLSGTSAKELIIMSFENVYFALAFQNLPYNLWRHLEVHTKPLSFFKDWDKCKKLTIAVVEYFIANGWSIKDLTESIRNDELYQIVWHQYKKRAY